MIGFREECTAALAVSDLDRAIGFYRDVLGLKVGAVMPDFGWASIRTPVANLTIGLGQAEEVPTGGGATLTFEVEDIDAARAELEKNSVRFDGDTFDVGGQLRIATFFDPDGNQLMLTEHARA